MTDKDCFLANMVTDVVVQGPANANTTGTDAAPGAVLAAVGWRAGTKPNADGSQQSPGNGMYESDSGEPGSFKNLDFAGNSTPIPPDVLTQSRIGRIALGIADGADQDHRVVYALVQDAVKFNGGVVGLDANENGTTSAAQSDYLNGLWASTDFGHTWKMVEGSTAIDNDATSNSALAPPTCKTPALISYCPGIQAWYNLWVQPDPTQSTASGVPTRLAFGLEELAGRRPPAAWTARPRRRASSAATSPARRAPCSTPPTGCRSARSPRAAPCRRPPRTPTSTPTSGCPMPPAAA